MNHYYQNIYFKKQCLKISAVFKENFLSLTIFENGAAWNLNLSKDEISKQARDIAKKDQDDVDVNCYYNNLKMYLRSCPEDVEFNFMDGELTINLLLKNKMKILFFTSTLKQVDFGENIFHLVERLYDDKTECFKKLDNLERQHKNLQTDNQHLNEKMERFLEQKKAEEEKLYSKFVTLLNEKKMHIQQLNDLVAVKKVRSANIPLINNRKNNNPSKKKILTKEVANTKMFSESEESNMSDNYKTDNDDADNIDEHINTFRISTKASSPGQTTSKSKSSFIEDAPTTVFTLSKRIRTNSNLNTSDQLPDKLLSRDSNIHENTSTMVSNTATKETSLTVNFNTQDLLDNL